MTRPICGDCTTCRPRTLRILGPRGLSVRDVTAAAPTAKAPKAPTVASLERHAKRFGPSQVAETAAEWGLSVSLEKAPPKSSASGPPLKTRVATLLDAGHSVETIAEIEDLSPARARRLVEEIREGK